MKLMKILRQVALAFTLFSAGVANAAVLQFTLTGDYSAQWRLNSTPMPDIVAPGDGFVIFDVDGFPDAIFGVADLTFYNTDLGGGLRIYDFFSDVDLLLTDGPQLYSGMESAPIFNVGTFSLSDFVGTGEYTLVITEVGDVAVPEPATGLLLLGALALMGAQRKRRIRPQDLS